MNINITGNLINAFVICQRKAWLYAHNIIPTNKNDNLEIGKLISEKTFKKEKKEILIENIKIDLIKKGSSELLVGEVKKSSSGIKAAEYQLLFYLYELKKKGISSKGMLLIPKEKRRIEINLNQKREKELSELMNKLIKITSSDKPPPVQRSKFCRNCSYFEFCWS